MSGLTPEQFGRLAVAVCEWHEEDGPRDYEVPCSACRMQMEALAPVVAALITEAVEEALLTEADWFDTAHANSADKGYTAHQRAGFGWAAGWIRLHARIARGEVSP